MVENEHSVHLGRIPNFYNDRLKKVKIITPLYQNGLQPLLYNLSV